MKPNKLAWLFTLALVALLAATGCKSKGPVKTTNLPTKPAIVDTETAVPDTRPIDTTSQQPVSQPYTSGPIGTSDTWDPSNYNPDPTKLAAYTVHFKFDSAVVEDSEQPNLTSVADALKSDPSARLLIQGHCDERGTEEYNRSLGERRALALREALAKIGVDAGNIRTISYGKDQPVDPDHNEAAWSKNRRGQFIWCTPKMIAQ